MDEYYFLRDYKIIKFCKLKAKPLQGIFKGKGFILDLIHLDMRESTVKGIWKSPDQIGQVVDWIWPVDWTGPWRGKNERLRQREWAKEAKRGSKRNGFNNMHSLNNRLLVNEKLGAMKLMSCRVWGREWDNMKIATTTCDTEGAWKPECTLVY